MADETTAVENAAESTVETKETFAHIAIRKFKKVAIYLIIVIAIALTISIISARQESAKLDAWNKILVATFTAQTTQGDLADEVSKATKGIAGTDAAQYGDMLVLSSAGITYDKSKLELAKAAGENFIKTNPKHPFISQVKLDYGTVLFNLEDYEGAVKAYSDAIDSNVTYLKAEALFFKGLALEKLGKDDEAIQTYTAVMDDIKTNDKAILSNIAEYAEFSRAKLQDKKAN